jgi:pyruvate dehydrogenase complex dehydrogenase (E1) component
LFEATSTTSQALARSLIELLDKHGLRKKIIAYVKDEGSNFNVMTTVLKVVVNYESVGLEESF